jgi:hypothetical protein
VQPLLSSRRGASTCGAVGVVLMPSPPSFSTFQVSVCSRRAFLNVVRNPATSIGQVRRPSRTCSAKKGE